MRHALMMIAAVGMLSIASAPANAAATPPYKLNSAGKCIGANGQFAKADLCKTPTAPPAAAKPTKCKDPKTKKFTKCTAPGAVPA
ncbi:hypothetical protein ACO2Q3_01485 [Caulobacter sp. KR2-114]|uniref:hypothetical protein n=1 Tax=Caulobacter sp. KR2-114 TaxID=3400912 RepID=UPI003C056C1E